MAPAASILIHVARNRIELQGFAVALLLWFPCVLAGVDSEDVNLSMEEMDGLQALWKAFSVKTPDPDRRLLNWRNGSHPCGFSSPNTYRRMDSSAWMGLTCQFHNDTNYTWVDGVTVTRLDLVDTGVVGVVPPEVSKLRNLERIGNFPFRSLINTSNLTVLDLSYNNYDGTIAEDAFQNLGQLQWLALGGNNFSGQIPDTSSLQENLTILDLSRNKFTDEAPDVSNLSNVSTLNMSWNNFTGQAPNLSKLTQLDWLDLSSNNFTGSLSELPESNASLYYVNISNNKFTGSVSSLLSSLAGATALTSLDLSNNKVGGPLPDLRDLSSLETLNLSSNNFVGLSNNVTFFLSTLPQQLRVLDISNLDIGGPVPHWANNNISHLQLSELYLDKNNFTGTLNISAFATTNISKRLKVLSLTDNMITDVVTSEGLVLAAALTAINVQGNPYCNKRWTSEDDSQRCTFYCRQPCIYLSPKSNNMGWKVITLATSISSAVVVLVILGFAVILRRKQKHIRDLQKKIKDADISAKRLEYSELRVATKNFASEMKLGEGAYGAVYKGILGNNLEVAVKQLFLETNKGRDDFLNEVLLISNLQHRNLVTLKGYCLHGKQTLLVYEYVDNCDLDKLLLCRHRSTDCTSDGTQSVLNWQARLNVCQGVAQGLYYLHASSQSRIIHRDIKASNILLDKNLQPKIADFGLARPIEDARSVILTQQCAGTLGYLAPEYMCHGQLSDKADVYSFGVLLLKIVSGKRNRDLSMPEDEVYLPNWAWKLHKESRLLDMKDPSLVLGEDEGEEVQRVLETAVVCVQTAPEKRPSMFLVAAMLAGQGRAGECGCTSVSRRGPRELAALRALLWKNVLTTEFPC
ncbi:hypothetical protein KC19_10G008900 [Ceratodon purpureus]|uniref:Protein kinase domain-containing protein n=1 Tax=Ceratodon purpureus TaxID=3225 RepID=A0A8T0GMA1_CERPU|nr:hypothetical protein KC19_10G008900 [Ceratodon purpureus]